MTRFSETDVFGLAGRTVVITGASSGLGREVTRALAGTGAHVVLAVRDVEKGERVARQIEGDTVVLPLDLADLASVRRFTDAWNGPLDVLINNAGIMAPPESRTAEGFELQIATNHLGPFLLTTRLLDRVTDRVVTVTSQLHGRAKLDLADLNWTARPYDGTAAYADSKLANLLFTLELQRRLTAAGSPVRALSAHPGIARTNLAPAAGGSLARFDRVLGRFFNDARRGALSITYAATQDVPGGSLVGPGGPGHLRGYPVVHAPARAATDARRASELWARSAELTGAPSMAGSPGAPSVGHSPGAAQAADGVASTRARI